MPVSRVNSISFGNTPVKENNTSKKAMVAGTGAALGALGFSAVQSVRLSGKMKAAENTINNADSIVKKAKEEAARIAPKLKKYKIATAVIGLACAAGAIFAGVKKHNEEKGV